VSQRGVVRLVARREFVERIRDRGFLISTGITLLIIVVVIGAGTFLGDPTRFELGVVGEGGRSLGSRVADAALALDFEVDLQAFEGRTEAERAVRDGEVDAAIVDGDLVLVRSEPPSRLVNLVQSVSARSRAQESLEAEGLSPERALDALEQPPLPVTALEPVDERRREYAAVAFVGVLALYGQLFAYGYWVAAGVVEEKASRVIEVLLATVRPSQLLRGKILGIGLLGLFQLFMIGAIGFGMSQLAGTLRFPAGSLAVIGVVLVWFVLGFFFYATLFAVAGSIVPRQEDLQSTMTPLSILIVASFFIGIVANENPGSTLAVIASLLPPSAPLVMPSRIVLGEATTWQALLSVAFSIAATVALVPVATNVYARGALKGGRVRLRQALRGTGD
jgi:ABC-2 type transport system permease protein